MSNWPTPRPWFLVLSIKATTGQRPTQKPNKQHGRCRSCWLLTNRYCSFGQFWLTTLGAEQSIHTKKIIKNIPSTIPSEFRNQYHYKKNLKPKAIRIPLYLHLTYLFTWARAKKDLETGLWITINLVRWRCKLQMQCYMKYFQMNTSTTSDRCLFFYQHQ